MEKIHFNNSIKMAHMWMTQRKKICAFPYQSSQEIEQYQLNQICKIISDACQYVPFYNRLYSRLHIYPDDIKTFEDFQRIPTISKNDIIGHEQDFLDRRFDIDSLIISRTSGTSGQFMNIYCSPDMFVQEELQVIRMIKELYPQYNALSKEVLVYTSEYPVSSILGFYRAYYINNLSPSEQIFDYIIKKKPSVLAIYPSILREITQKMADYDFSSLNIKLIITNSEQSSQDERDYFSDLFRCTVIDEFSSEEIQSIAYQCSQKKYHEVSDCSYIEVLYSDRDLPVPENTIGEITGTCLINRSMPLIRYRQGDYATRTSYKCSCGKNTKIIGSLSGRINSSFVMSDGSIIPSGRILDWSYHLVLTHGIAIRRFKIIQTDYRNIDILLESSYISPTDISRIEDSFLATFGCSFVPHIHVVDCIPKEDNGKYIPIISNISKNYSCIG